MRKLFVSFLAFVIIIAPLCAQASDDFIECADNYFSKASDKLSEKESYVLSASGTSPGVGEILFDFTEGNKTLLAIADGKCKVYAFFDDAELLGVLYRMITLYQDIEADLPEGKRLEYKIRISEDDTILLDSAIINSFFLPLSSINKTEQAESSKTKDPEATAVPKSTAVPAAHGTKTVFLPSYMIRTYNENIGSFFEVTSDADHSFFDTYFSVTLQDSSNGKLIYENSDSMIIITYSASDPDSIADEMTFWTSHKYDYRNIPQFCFAWAVTSNFVDNIYDLDFFTWLNGAKNGDTFSCDAFSAVYVADPDNYSSFVLTRK